HWLGSRLSGVQYEPRDYRGALEAAEKALEIVPDCPLALWSKATAQEMLGETAEAKKLYLQLIKRGLEEIQHPDANAEECWEGSEWTFRLLADCVFRSAGCQAKMRMRDRAIQMYQNFLNLQDLGIPSIYSREHAMERLNKLVPSKKGRREAALSRVVDTELISAP